MPSCERCGFYLSHRNTACGSCLNHRVIAYDLPDPLATDHRREPTRPRAPLSPGIAVKWIATAPFVLVGSFLLGGYTDFFSPLGHLIIVFYLSAAFLIDARQLTLHGLNWSPNLYFWAIVSVLNVVAFGLLTFVIAPYYLYRRRLATNAE